MVAYLQITNNTNNSFYNYSVCIIPFCCQNSAVNMSMNFLFKIVFFLILFEMDAFKVYKPKKLKLLHNAHLYE